MRISPIGSDEEILATYEVMCQLRPHLSPEGYLSAVRRMTQSDGYHLVAVWERDAVRAVAGYRYMEMLSRGRTLYVDDLVTDARVRSQGNGKYLLDWLRAEAATRGCAALHLDSGVQREQAHRFYFREGLTVNAFHFRVALREDSSASGGPG